MGYEKQMKNLSIDKGFPSIGYIVNNWPQTKNILKKFILSNHKKPDLCSLAITCMHELQVFKINSIKSVLIKCSKLCARNINYNTYHDQHHFKSVLVISCILAKHLSLNYRERVLLIFIALTHDMNHQGRRVLGAKPFYQENKSYEGLEKLLFKKILNYKEMKRIKRIFQSTYFPVKPDHVNDEIEKIILDADILSSLMFGPDVGIKLARRLKHEIRYNEKTELLFTNFLKLLGEKCLYLDFSKNSC